ncbi:hypothetical protein MLD38_035328 [Melastoma candidum]|uniref:Uncharacterized protein n=1 Tax=Melastoma candidum TaxID=119954 RepID=A0ACB9LGD6_9MYRT|nr:hypothetical protein MLD38_035328 [Melastoma candidum]
MAASAFPSSYPCSVKKAVACSGRGRELAVAKASNKDVDNSVMPVSPGELCVRGLYYSINEKDAKESRRIVAEDCCFRDYAFTKPFNGNKEIVAFLEQLGVAMGKNVKFCLEEVHEDGEAAWASWHLEWKGSEIPLTRGCSNFRFSKQGDGVLIRKAQVFIESPIKPGGFVLILLKAVTSLFDEFPKATESFLKSPEAVILFVQRIYLMFLMPFIKPLLSSYINLGQFVARALGYILSVLILFLKLIFK